MKIKLDEALWLAKRWRWKMGDPVPPVTRSAPPIAGPVAPVEKRATASTKHVPAKTSRVSLPKYPKPASVARAHDRTSRPSLSLRAQAAENRAIKVYALVEAERDKLAGKSADTDAAGPDVSKAPDSVTFERHQKAVIDVATENLGLQNALVAEARQTLADAKQKLDTAKANEEDAANETYNVALLESKYADYSVKTAERLLLKATGTKRGLAVATDDKVLDAVAKLRRAEDASDNLDKPRPPQGLGRQSGGMESGISRRGESRGRERDQALQVRLWPCHHRGERGRGARCRSLIAPANIADRGSPCSASRRALPATLVIIDQPKGRPSSPTCAKIHHANECIELRQKSSRAILPESRSYCLRNLRSNLPISRVSIRCRATSALVSCLCA
jgi:hypothetical protein